MNELTCRVITSVQVFYCRIVGNSYRETVFIFNTSQNKTLRMEKIAGSKHSQIQIASFGDEVCAILVF